MNKTIFYIFCFGFLAFMSTCVKKIHSDKFSTIEIFTIIFGKPLSSYEITSSGEILQLELSSHSEKIRIYRSYFKDSMLIVLNDLVNQVKKIEKDKSKNNFRSCVDGTSYQIRIKNKDGVMDISNTICDKTNEIDEFVLKFLNYVSKRKKDTVFNKYMEYENMVRGFDSLLNHK